MENYMELKDCEEEVGVWAVRLWQAVIAFILLVK